MTPLQKETIKRIAAGLKEANQVYIRLAEAAVNKELIDFENHNSKVGELQREVNDAVKMLELVITE